jgi:hypothetical protein
MIRVMRVMRVIRVIRVIRVVRVIRMIRVMIECVTSSAPFRSSGEFSESEAVQSARVGACVCACVRVWARVCACVHR